MRPFVLVRDLFLIILVALVVFAAIGRLSWIWIAVLTFLYFSLLVLGASIIRLNFFIPAFHHGSRSVKQVALSFDDGPTTYTEAILDVLKEEGVPAAFFCIGQRAEQAPDVVRRWHEEGHLVGNHSYTHSVHFGWKRRRQMVCEINRTNEVIRRIIGVLPKTFRPPFGVTNPELSQAVNLTGMHTIGWSLRSLDTASRDADKLLQKLLNQVKDGDVILLHDSVVHTASILTAFIRACRQKGFTFVRLDKMLGLEAYA